MIPGIAILTLLAASIRQISQEDDLEHVVQQLWVLWDLQQEQGSPLAPTDALPWRQKAFLFELPPGWNIKGTRPQRTFALGPGEAPQSLEDVLCRMVDRYIEDPQLYVLFNRPGWRGPFIAVPHPGWSRAMKADFIRWISKKIVTEAGVEHVQQQIDQRLVQSTFPIQSLMALLTAIRSNPYGAGWSTTMRRTGVLDEVHDWIYERLMASELESPGPA